MMFTSCADWLDVQPSDTASEDKLFEVSAGYRVALNGIYKLASSPSLYGKEMTWGLMSVHGRDYILNNDKYIPRNDVYAVISDQYKYQNTQAIALIDNIWKTSYKCIVNCNNLIGKIKKEDPKIFSLGVIEQNLIQGEAMAMRAMLHFDILRVYAPAPIMDDGKSYIPYYDQDGLSTGQPPLTVKQTLAKVVEDLKAARELVTPYDMGEEKRQNMMMLNFRFDSEESFRYMDNPDIFFTTRGYRMNYSVITAMLARVYNYMGEHKLAYDEALKASEMSTDYSGYTTKLFNFTTLIDIKFDRKTQSDLIFTLQDPRLYENYLPYSLGGNVDYCYFVLADNLVSIFTDPGDYRITELSQTDSNGKKKPLKNVEYVGSGAIREISDMLPMIKLSEMYYIQAEYFASLGMYTEALAAIDRVRIGRNCTSGGIVINDKSTFEKELINEARREFYSEGQTFFYYKKLGIKPKSTMKDDQFSFIKPLDEDVQI